MVSATHPRRMYCDNDARTNYRSTRIPPVVYKAGGYLLGVGVRLRFDHAADRVLNGGEYAVCRVHQ